MDDGLHVQLLGRHQRKALRQVKAHLVPEDAARAGAGAVVLHRAVLQHMAHQVEILLHRTLLFLGDGATINRFSCLGTSGRINTVYKQDYKTGQGKVMQAVLFDCDGVLINSELLIDRAQEAVLARYGMAYTARQFMEHFTGLSRELRYARFAEEYQRLHGEVMPASVVRELEDACNDFMARLMAVPEGMAAMLDRLRAAGIPCAVASNSTQDRLEAKLRQVGLYDAFAPHIYGIDHVSRPK